MKQLFIALVAFATLGLPAQAQQTADTVFVNGKFYTVEASQPWAEAVAVKDGRFISVGSNSQIETLKGPGTRVVDLKGKFAMPGFIDAHTHPIRSQLMAGVDFRIGADVPPSPEEFSAALKAYADANPTKPWITGGAFSWGTFTDVELNAAFLDATISDRPVVIEDETGHIAIANSRALEIAGVTKDTEDPTGGYFGREEDGSLNGLLYETAMQEVFKHSPNYPQDRVYSAARQVFPKLNQIGITGVKIAQGDHLWANAVNRLDKEGLLTHQVSMMVYEVDFYRRYSNLDLIEDRENIETDHFRIDGVKLFADGVPFGQTMLIKRPYPGTDNFGLAMTPRDELIQKIVDFNGMGLSVMVHSTGDAGTETVIAGTEASMMKNGAEEVRALRNHIAHNVIVDPADFERMKYTNVVMEFSPSFWFPRPIIDQAKADLGERINEVWPLGQTLRAGVNVAVGSDWNQAQADPFVNTETLVTRRAPGAKPGDAILGKDSGATLEQVLHAYTMGGAYSMFMENEIGSIRTGKRANFVVLDQDLTAIPVNEIHKTIVLETWFEGQSVYSGTTKVSL